MARFNQQLRRRPTRRMQADRQASLEARGVNVAAIMKELGIGERRAMAESERRLGIYWHNGSFGLDAGHYEIGDGTGI
jgi:hypothetical protein